jgi:hypothetical protein
MTGMGWLVLGIIFGAFLILALALCMASADSEELDRRCYHPPDDDDGVSRLEDDPDGQYTR